MNIQDAFTLLFTHGIPILFFMYMATDVLLRNQRKTEHILLSLIAVCYMLLFVEEYVRNQVSIEYSPVLSSLWLSSVGIVIPGLCFHFLIKFSQLDKKMPRFLYPYIFYLPLLFVAVNLASGAGFIAAQEFTQAGLWKLPVYNAGYYIAMTASIFTDLIYLIPLLIAKSRSVIPEQRSIYNQLIWGVAVSILWHVAFGYINYGDTLPPYPYLYSGIVWCYFLRHTMKKHDFLNLYDKRFEKLFQLNPDAILLIDSSGRIKNANPGASQLFGSMDIDNVRITHLLDAEIKNRITSKVPIKQYESEIQHNGKRMSLLVNADYVWVDNEHHVLLILRDITAQKQHQEEIRFLAYHDPLTRLPNRRYFYERLDEALQYAEQHRETLALLLIDLDKLKILNDTRGHLAGDEALQRAAQILQETIGDRGVAARMGGDEFIVFIGRSPSPQDVQNTVQQMQHQFASFLVKYGNLPLGMSIGVSYYPADAAEGQALINLADHAMFEMKRLRA
ncbi:diguanylate cyclase domain-containing protein [Paenibacillus sp. GCM10012303]|uniref:diguanylate cyclase domain-containing protein n=1 Tax=Paenibacillus sp. GCM10012303 TaxID=3317340 RepID=UPI0036D28C14